MARYYTHTIGFSNIHKKPSKKSEVVSQMIFGDTFSISKKINQWLKIKTKEDNYIGYIKNQNYIKYSKPTHKVNILRAIVYKFPNKDRKIYELPFNSKIKVLEKKKNFLNFLKAGLIKIN
jgi:hypothetical protein